MARTRFAALIMALLIPVAAQAGGTGRVAGSEGGALTTAATAADLAREQALLDRGADTNARDEKGATALHHAAALAGGLLVGLVAGVTAPDLGAWALHALHHA